MFGSKPLQLSFFCTYSGPAATPNWCPFRNLSSKNFQSFMTPFHSHAFREWESDVNDIQSNFEESRETSFKSTESKRFFNIICEAKKHVRSTLTRPSHIILSGVTSRCVDLGVKYDRNL